MAKKHLPSVINSVLYICKGNVCRSAMAEFISNQIGSVYGIHDIKFCSRGLEVTRQNPASEGARAISTANGIDMSSHVSMPVSQDVMDDVDLVLAMEYGQMTELILRYPSSEKKIFLLPYFFDNKYKGTSSWIIRDPYGCSLDVYQNCYFQIRQCIEGFFKKLKANGYKGD